MARKAKAQKTMKVDYLPGVNLRAEPSLTASILRVLKHGETVQLTGKEAPDEWVSVVGGFCMKKYLT